MSVKYRYSTFTGHTNLKSRENIFLIIQSSQQDNRNVGDSELFIKQRHTRNCYKADPAYGAGVAKALGIDLQEALKE
jgi:catalase